MPLSSLPHDVFYLLLQTVAEDTTPKPSLHESLKDLLSLSATCRNAYTTYSTYKQALLNTVLHTLTDPSASYNHALVLAAQTEADYYARFSDRYSRNPSLKGSGYNCPSREYQNSAAIELVPRPTNHISPTPLSLLLLALKTHFLISRFSRFISNIHAIKVLGGAYGDFCPSPTEWLAAAYVYAAYGLAEFTDDPALTGRGGSPGLIGAGPGCGNSPPLVSWREPIHNNGAAGNGLGRPGVTATKKVFTQQEKIVHRIFALEITDLTNILLDEHPLTKTRAEWAELGLEVEKAALGVGGWRAIGVIWGVWEIGEFERWEGDQRFVWRRSMKRLGEWRAKTKERRMEGFERWWRGGCAV